MSNASWIEEDEHQRFQSRVWQKILMYTAPYRWQLLGLTIAGLWLGLLDTSLPMLTAWIIDEARQHGWSTRQWLYGGLYLSCMLMFATCIWLFIRWAGQTVTGVAYDLRQVGFERLQAFSFSYYDKHSTGWLVTRLTSDCSKISSIIPWFLLDMVWGSSMILGISVAMLWLHWQLGLIVISTIPVLVGISVYFQIRLLDSSRKIRKTNSQITATYNESLMGVRTSKTLVREQKNLHEFQELSSRMYGDSLRNAIQASVYLPLITSVGSLGVGLALWFGGSQLSTSGMGQLTLGQLIAFMQYAGLLYLPIQEIARRFAELQSAQAAAERMQSLLETQPDIQDSPEVLAVIEQTKQMPKTLEMASDGKPHRIEHVDFHHVFFAYKETEPVIHDFNLHVMRGQTVALVGETGSGKSTLVNLLARFYEPTQGEIRINGEDYRKRSLHWLQSQLGVVLQTPHLFRGSVRENIRYGRLDASDLEVEEAARMVHAHTFIVELSDGYDTDVGESGNHLSTGQRQLISLARAFLADPQIVIMDEATSSIDTSTEQIIQEATQTMLAGRLAFVIAHRLSTVRSADQILVIEKGCIVEQGTHRELMNRRGHYYNLYTRQFVQQAYAHLSPTSSPAL